MKRFIAIALVSLAVVACKRQPPAESTAGSTDTVQHVPATTTTAAPSSTDTAATATTMTTAPVAPSDTSATGNASGVGSPDTSGTTHT
jgi:hypothetical protein